MSKNVGKFLRSLITLLVFGVSLWILYHYLREYNYHDVVRDLHVISHSSLYLAVALTFLNFLVLTCYDILALQYIRHPLPYAKIAFASFIGYAFSQSFGIPVLTSASVRYRLYSTWQLTSTEIAQVVGFTSFTLWLGIFTIGGFAFAVGPPVPASFHLPFTSRTLGMLLLCGPVAYCVWIAKRKEPLKIREWAFPTPSLKLTLLQILASSFDWAIAAGTLYILLPPASSIPYLQFLWCFLAAQILGMVSSVPGGLGVFDGMMLLLLSPQVPSSALAGSLLAFRGIYYLLPLAISLFLFVGYEVLKKWKHKHRAVGLFGAWLPRVAPTVFAFAVFVGGMILLFSGATPTVHSRLNWLRDFVPLPLLELSHFLGSLAGVGLLILARGLQRRLDGAYVMTAVLLGIGCVASLLKGFDYEEAILMAVLLGALLPCRSYFYRKAAMTRMQFTRGWIVTIFLILASSLWLTLFCYKHVPYSHELWWQFTFSGDAPRSLRAATGAFGVAFLVAFAQLLRPAAPLPMKPNKEELERVREIISRSRLSAANLALLGDKEFILAESGQSFLMFRVEGRSWISLSDPVGPDEEKKELIWRFREIADRHNGWTVFYEIAKPYLPLYLDLGLTLLKLGEEARVSLESFSMEGNSRKTFRHLLNKFDKENYSFEIVPPAQVGQMIPTLREISDTWLKGKNTKEKGFSLGFFDEQYLEKFPLGIVRSGNRVLAFVNIWLSAEKEELSLDLMRFPSEAPNGVMDYLFVKLMLWGKQEGYRWFNLGMAPLSGLDDRALAPLWNRLGAFLFRHGEHFYNFQGLRQYKEKFDPVWEPKYLASPGGLALPLILTNLGTLISGGLKGVVTK